MQFDEIWLFKRSNVQIFQHSLGAWGPGAVLARAGHGREVPGAEAAPLALFDAVALRTQPTPLFPVEFFANSRWLCDDLALAIFVLVGARGVGINRARTGARPVGSGRWDGGNRSRSRHNLAARMARPGWMAISCHHRRTRRTRSETRLSFITYYKIILSFLRVVLFPTFFDLRRHQGV